MTAGHITRGCYARQERGRRFLPRCSSSQARDREGFKKRSGLFANIQGEMTLACRSAKRRVFDASGANHPENWRISSEADKGRNTAPSQRTRICVVGQAALLENDDMEFLEHPTVLILVGALSIPIYISLAKLFWGERFESLGETIKYVLTPDIYSLFKGRFWEDWDKSFGFQLYLFLCFAWAAAVTELLARHVL